MSESHGLVVTQRKDVGDRHDAKRHQNGAPDAGDTGNESSRESARREVAVAYGGHGDDNTVNAVVVGVHLAVHAILLLSVVGNLEYSHKIAQNQDGGAEHDEYSPLGVDDHLAFESEANTSTEPVTLAQFFRICVCVNAIVENRPDQKVNPKPHNS